MCEGSKRAISKCIIERFTAVLSRKCLAIMLTGEFEYGLSLIILKKSDRHVNNTENFIFTTGL